MNTYQFIDDGKSAIFNNKRKEKLRRQGIIHSCIGAAIAVLLYYLLHFRILPVIMLIISGVTLVIAIVFTESAYQRISDIIGYISLFIGKILTTLLLIPVYYLFFTPFGLLFRRGKNDPLLRRIDPSSKSYWMRRPDVPIELNQYERQF